jgi:hypothetical protein
LLSHLRFLGAPSLAVVLSLPALSARADEPPEIPAPPPRKPPYRFTGLALYAGGGAGALVDVGEFTQNWRLLVTVPLARWAMFEGFAFGYHALAASHHGREHTVALGIGAGVRFAPPPNRAIRPYGAIRLVHVHYVPEIWGEHVESESGDSHDHAAAHRWGVALAGGFDAAPFRSVRRLRVGFDLEATLLSGPGANVGIGGLAFVGWSF